MNKPKKIVLAYSDGLDTSVILHWLVSQGHEIITYTANLGQEVDTEEVIAKARQVGAIQAYVEDLREEFVTDFIFPAIRANAIYEGRYLLGTSLARPLTARGQVQTAHEGLNYHVRQTHLPRRGIPEDVIHGRLDWL